MNEALEELRRVIGATAEVVPVPVQPEGNANQCYYNVRTKVDRDGGSTQYGWTFNASTYLMFAIPHSVWRSPQSELIDLTPSSQVERTDRIATDVSDDGKRLFLPDDDAVLFGGDFPRAKKAVALSASKTAKERLRRFRQEEWPYEDALRRKDYALAQRILDIRWAKKKYNI